MQRLLTRPFLQHAMVLREAMLQGTPPYSNPICLLPSLRQVSEAVGGAASEIGRRLSERLATKQDVQALSVKVRQVRTLAILLLVKQVVCAQSCKAFKDLCDCFDDTFSSLPPHHACSAATLSTCDRSTARCLARMWSACCGPTRWRWHPRLQLPQPPTPTAQVRVAFGQGMPSPAEICSAFQRRLPSRTRFFLPQLAVTDCRHMCAPSLPACSCGHALPLPQLRHGAAALCVCCGARERRP